MPIPALPLFIHRDTVVTPADQNQFVTQFENTMDTLSNGVIPAMNDAIIDINGKVITATTARDEAEDARDITVSAKNEAVTAVATLQAGAIDDTTIAPNKAFSNQYIENYYYDKTEVDTAISDATLDINALPDKPTPDDTDNFALQEVGGDLKKVSFQNLTKLSPNDDRVKTALNASGTAPIYACRAWVNFNGTGTVAIRESGNVSSITDNGVGNYSVNFTTAMIDVNYVQMATAGSTSTWVPVVLNSFNTSTQTINASRVFTINTNSSDLDVANIHISIFR